MTELHQAIGEKISVETALRGSFDIKEGILTGVAFPYDVPTSTIGGAFIIKKGAILPSEFSTQKQLRIDHGNSVKDIIGGTIFEDGESEVRFVSRLNLESNEVQEIIPLIEERIITDVSAQFLGKGQTEVDEKTGQIITTLVSDVTLEELSLVTKGAFAEAEIQFAASNEEVKGGGLFKRFLAFMDNNKKETMEKELQEKITLLTSKVEELEGALRKSTEEGEGLKAEILEFSASAFAKDKEGKISELFAGNKITQQQKETLEGMENKDAFEASYTVLCSAEVFPGAVGSASSLEIEDEEGKKEDERLKKFKASGASESAIKAQMEVE